MAGHVGKRIRIVGNKPRYGFSHSPEPVAVEESGFGNNLAKEPVLGGDRKRER